MSTKFSLFTKPWKTLSVWELCSFVKGMGFDGVEFPLREGFQLELPRPLSCPVSYSSLPITA